MTRPKHGSARVFFRQGLFRDLADFPDLEGRIARLPTEKARGEAFEVFAEAYIATQALHQAVEVWPFQAIPLSLKRRLGFTRRDMGVDGLFRTRAGEVIAFQVKFRATRASLPWDPIATFMGLTDLVDQRVLFTNCEGVSPATGGRRAFSCITGRDLDRLDRAALSKIARWLEGCAVVALRKEPKAHQQEAVDAIVATLRGHDRTTAVMACGTGKTLVGLWVAEQLQPRSVLVLVPSLALLRQTVREWMEQTHWAPVAYRCVCSDTTIEDRDMDEFSFNPSDLGFPVTTDHGTVRRFLRHKRDGVTIVFATYQSANVVASGMPGDYAFDVAVFDEAHRTAGRLGAHFTQGLKDENLPIRRRLFLTATPRHYELRARKGEERFQRVYSMDDPTVYGPVAYRLPVAQATERKIIVDYKVIISVVTNTTVTNQRLRSGEVRVRDDLVKAGLVANQIALQKAVRKYRVEKIFTFHNRVRAAHAFTMAPDGEGVGHYLRGFEAFHVNGQMPTAERFRELEAFERARRAIMSNARCLAEGVDVPAVDMVAFLAPKRSRVDVVQAIGRALRTREGKTTGYILLPLFLEQAAGETLKQAVERAGCEEIWNVLWALKEQDDVLADVIRDMREARGHGKGFDDSRFRERVAVLGPELSLGMMRKAITTACINVLGSLWDERYGELRAYRDRFGHCNVPVLRSKKLALATWVNEQRKKKRRDALSEDRVQRLDALGFQWAPFDAAWEAKLAALAAFSAEHGHCNVPMDWDEDPALGRWVGTQRRTRRRVSPEKRRRLDQLGFVWVPFTAKWGQMYAALIEYKTKYGDCNVPLRWPGNPKLGHWVMHQRVARRGKRIDGSRIRRLDELGFIWDPPEAAWEQRMAELVAYRDRHGHCNVPDRWPKNRQLGIWVRSLRNAKREGRLDPEQTRRLDALEMVWAPYDLAWEERFRELVRYKHEHGSVDVPARWPPNPSLAHWVHAQRTRMRKGTLREERARRLKAIGLN